jgi:hypothetical protein
MGAWAPRSPCASMVSSSRGAGGRVRPHEKGDRDHEIPTHRNLDRYLEENIAAPTSARTAREGDDGRGRILSLRFAMANQSSAKRPGSVTENADVAWSLSGLMPSRCAHREHGKRDPGFRAVYQETGNCIHAKWDPPGEGSHAVVRVLRRGYLAAAAIPACSARMAALSVASQVNSGSLRPKWP